MKIKNVVVTGLLAGSMAAHAVTLVTEPDGVLTGARDVNILGSFYDVAFKVGRCSTFYGDCGPGGNFGGMYQPPDPQKQSFAFAASEALLYQVLTGPYDLNAGLTSGCGGSVGTTFGRCYILTPYWWQNTLVGTASGMVYAVTVNGSELAHNILSPYPVYSNDDMVMSSMNLGNRHPAPLTDGGIDPASAFSVWAVWSESVSPVPEPETYAMMLAGLGLLGVVTRRRKQKLNA